MRRIVLRTLLVVVCLTSVLGVWILVGEKLSLFIDRLATLHLASLPIRPLAAYDGEEGTHHSGSLQIGGKAMSNEAPDYMAYPLHLRTNSQNQLILTANGKSFTLGPVSSTQPDDVGRVVFEFAPEPGDDVSFTLRRSLLSWPTPLEFNFLTGAPATSWRRHLYFRLAWAKPSGARLEMSWHYRQDFNAASGWTEVWTREGSAGLTNVSILP